MKTNTTTPKRSMRIFSSVLDRNLTRNNQTEKANLIKLITIKKTYLPNRPSFRIKGEEVSRENLENRKVRADNARATGNHK